MANSPSLLAYTGLSFSHGDNVSLMAIKSTSRQHVSCQGTSRALPSQQAWAAPGTSPSTCWLQSQGTVKSRMWIRKTDPSHSSAGPRPAGQAIERCVLQTLGFPLDATPCGPGERQEAGLQRFPGVHPFSASIRPPPPRRSPPCGCIQIPQPLRQLSGALPRGSCKCYHFQSVLM